MHKLQLAQPVSELTGRGRPQLGLARHQAKLRARRWLADPQISMADQLGLRRVISNTFKTLWVVPSGADRTTLDAYFRVLEQAEADLAHDPGSCLPLWRYSSGPGPGPSA